MFGGAHELLRRNHGPRAGDRRVPALAVQGRCAGRKRHSDGATHRIRGAGHADQAYCSQLLCGVPYEVARSAGHFKNHGLDVQLVYTRGGNAAVQALVAGAVDYAATSLDVAIQAYANVGADIRRFAVTGRLPLFAVVTSPKTASQ